MNLDKKILISIITVVRNDEENIEKTIKSIINQKDKFVEYIVIDGDSTDNTKEIINKYINYIDKFISEPDKNLYDAINKGMKLSNGKIIGVCLSGDDYKPGAFNIVKNYFEKNRNADFFFGSIIRNYIGATIIKQGFYPKKILYNFDAQTSISTGFFITKSAQKKVGEYDLNFPVSSDYDFFYRIMIKHKLKGISSNKDEIVGEMSAGGLSSKLTYFDHLIEESKIRLKNKQNILLIILIIFNGILKNIPRIIRDLKVYFN
jgi:glycosyltransferase involved in cell wall biosynthesis